MIAVSESLGDYARLQGIDPDLIHVVPNGVPVAGSLANRRTPGGTGPWAPWRLSRLRKGLEVLLQAWRSCASKGCMSGCGLSADSKRPTTKPHPPRGRAVFVGEHIDWTGFTRDVPAELARLDLFVLPSLFGEGLPMVVLEAMAAGVPVVATRVEGIPEAIATASTA